MSLAPQTSGSLHYYFSETPNRNLHLEADICVYTANSGGIIAAIAARRKGLKVVLLNPGRYLGGLTTGGLGFTDIGNKFAIGGLAREFYRRVGNHYGKPEWWRFEPSIAEKVFLEWLAQEEIICYNESFLDRVEITDGRITRVTTENGITVEARIFIDASYEGDLMAKAGVSHTVGREDNSCYGETYNGSQARDQHQFNFPVDPYREEGNPASGLLTGIDSEPYVPGQGDKRVQAYNFRLCLTNNPNNRLPFTEPEGYERSDYELLARYCRAGYVPEFSKFDSLINDKVDMNNRGAVSTDFIGMNYDYPEASYLEREQIFQAHVLWIKGLLWFWSSDSSIPAEFQEKIRHWGWCRDEFQETGGFPHALYVREARRLVGDVVMTEHHCTGAQKADEPIALAAYTMDSHNCRRIVVDGQVRNEGDVQIKSGPAYPVSYRCIIPKRGECRNLFIPFCLSASHIAFGSIRMEPVFMILAESAVEAAALALEKGLDVQEIPYAELRSRLLQARQIIDPVPDVKNHQFGE